MTPFPPTFTFTQSALQDYTDCKRRFQLRYLDHLAWPAIETEPAQIHEQHLQQGARFHQLVQQHQLGLPIERLNRLVVDPALTRWWENYLAYPLPDLPRQRLTETLLAAPLAGYRLMAKYDLLAVEPGRAVIVDWKTSQPQAKRPKNDHLLNRLQTRVYRFLLVEAGAHLNGGIPFRPEQVEMIYWFAEFPDHPYHFPYATAQYKADRDILSQLIEEISTLVLDPFPLTPHEKHCAYCSYRSLCERGIRAGDFDDWESHDAAPVLLDFDLDQIAEIEF